MNHLAGRDVRAVVRGALDSKVFWVLFGPGDCRVYCVESYVRRRGQWVPNGDGFESDHTEHAGWDMLGILFVRAFTQE